MIDYRELLKKYINHVGYMEGVTFMPQEYDKDFSEEERAVLLILDSEGEEEFSK